MLREVVLAQEPLSALRTRERTLAAVNLLVLSQSVLDLEALVAEFAGEGPLGSVHAGFVARQHFFVGESLAADGAFVSGLGGVEP